MYIDLNIIAITLIIIFSPIFYVIKSKATIQKLEKKLNDYDEGLEGIIEYRIQKYKLQKDRAIESNKYKSDYISNMAIELITTVNCILDFSLIGKNNIGVWSNGKHSQNYDLLINNASKFSIKIKKLIDISKLEAGRMYFHFTQKTIVEVIGQSLIELQELAKSRKIIYDIDEPNDFTKATFDFNSLIKVTTTILKYIIDNSSYDSTINISMGDTVIVKKDFVHNAVFCTISCENNFTITEETVLFNQYNCKDVDFNICKEIIDLHKGKIWTEYTDNTYKFCYSIPCVREEVMELEKAA